MEERDYVEEARAILVRAGFPVDQIAITPARGLVGSSAAPTVDRKLLLEEARTVMADGVARRAREIAAMINQRRRLTVEKRDVNSVLSREGKPAFAYDAANYTYRLVG